MSKEARSSEWTFGFAAQGLKARIDVVYRGSMVTPATQGRGIISADGRSRSLRKVGHDLMLEGMSPSGWREEWMDPELLLLAETSPFKVTGAQGQKSRIGTAMGGRE